MKRECTNCGVLKTDEQFCSRWPKLCLECNRERSRRSRQSERGQEWIKEYSKKRYLKFKHKSLARAKTRNAVKAGKIVKPNHCSNCRKEAPLQGHHEDYSKPLEVQWLCDSCHKHTHGKLKDLTLIGASHE